MLRINPVRNIIHVPNNGMRAANRSFHSGSSQGFDSDPGLDLLMGLCGGAIGVFTGMTIKDQLESDKTTGKVIVVGSSILSGVCTAGASAFFCNPFVLLLPVGGLLAANAISRLARKSLEEPPKK